MPSNAAHAACTNVIRTMRHNFIFFKLRHKNLHKLNRSVTKILNLKSRVSEELKRKRHKDFEE